MSIDRVNGFFGSSASQIKKDGVANPGTSTYSAREDHVHPADTSKADADDVAALESKLADDVAALESKLADDVAALESKLHDGVIYGIGHTVAVESWVAQGEGTSYDAEIPIPELNSESVVQLLPAASTFAAFDALAVSVKTKAEGVLTITTTALPAAEIGLNVLYTKPIIVSEPEPEPEPEP